MVGLYCRHHFETGGKQDAGSSPHTVYPAVEIRQIDAIVVLDGGVAFGVGLGIQNDLQRTDDNVVFRHNIGHLVL